ncbi:SH2 domain-containing adapter protein D isoform X2 [Salmo salar]|uniref:SH2 domain-containing adapter protein D isoform X2 n=1 Tax=Salmo salar TaxID=8030 RepID=A0ABM3CA86_SALSA|nr:SH2 domain-containing adapter protein D isoform X2 [Salmo salar]
MAKWLKDYLSFGSRRMPPQPPKPDYTESEILKAYRAQKKLDFEDPYEDSENRARNESGSSDSSYPAFGSPLKSASLDMKVVSPKHRLIKMDSQDLGRTKILLSAVSLEDQEPVVPSAPAVRDADYSDPFDAHPNPRPEPDLGPVQCENNGYMEPYEAQRVITELQHGPGVGRTRGEVQLYDTPYENERGRGRPLWVGLGYGDPLEEGRESRLPQDDERPADEYDQPWEWKKENISKAFAVQFDGAEWERSSSPTERLRPPRSSPLAGGSRKFRMPCPDPHNMMGERVDPTLPLEKQVSCQGFMHIKFSQCKDGKYVLGQNSLPFNTIPEVIHFYTTHKLPIRGAEHLSLLFPVLVQTL